MALVGVKLELGAFEKDIQVVLPRGYSFAELVSAVGQVKCRLGLQGWAIADSWEV